jgi:hypothetical protein
MQTCVLYPLSDCPTLSEWINSRPEHFRSLPVNLVVIDGTYSQAKRQIHHLSQMLSLNEDGTAKENIIPLPVVKLDFGMSGGSCRSSLAKIRYQPSADKICSMQAVVLAMREMGVDNTICDELLNKLEEFLKQILDKRVFA